MAEAKSNNAEYITASERFAQLIVPPRFKSDFEKSLSPEKIINGSTEEVANFTQKYIQEVFGNKIPIFATQIHQDQIDSPEATPQIETALSRVILHTKLTILFCLKHLCENQDILWAKADPEAALKTKHPGKKLTENIAYITQLVTEIIRSTPTQEAANKLNYDAHERSWALSRIFDDIFQPNCVTNAWLLTVGATQVHDWDRTFISHLRGLDQEGMPEKHMELYLPNTDNPALARYVDTLHGSILLPASSLHYFSPEANDLVANPQPGKVAEVTNDELFGTIVQLPSKMFITDPLTALTTVNLHHSGVASSLENMEVNPILLEAAKTVSPVLFEYWTR